MKPYVPAGVLPASVLPLNADQSVDEGALGELLTWLVGHDGVTAVVVNAVAGEGNLLTPSEAARVVDVAVEAVGDRVAVIAGVAGERPADARSLAADLLGRGATAGLAQAPNLFSRGIAAQPDVAVRYFTEVAEAGLPLIIFQHQAVTGRWYPPSLLASLLAIDGVVGVKETSWDVARYERTVRTVQASGGGAAVLCANDDLLLPCLSIAPIDGVLLGLCSLIPDLVSDLFASTQRGDLDAARALAARMAPLVETIYAEPSLRYYARLKAACRLRGLPVAETLRAPQIEVTQQERLALRTGLDQAGVLA